MDGEIDIAEEKRLPDFFREQPLAADFGDDPARLQPVVRMGTMSIASAAASCGWRRGDRE
jgi:hypothetical protein